MKYSEITNNIWEHRNADARIGAKRLVVLASMHGDEPAGLAALDYVKSANIPLSEHIHSIILIVGNPKALEKGVRAIDVDLNRVWNEKEDHDTTTIEYQRYLEIRPVLFQPNTVALDLHTTSSEHHPIVMLDHDPVIETKEVVSRLPAEYVTHNWQQFIGEKTISGGLYAYDENSLSFAYELGQHKNKHAEKNGIQAASAFIEYYNNAKDTGIIQNDQIWLKVLQQFSLPEINWEWHKIEKGPFQIEAGELLGYADGAKYHAPIDGYLIMPNRKFGPTNSDVGFFAVEAGASLSAEKDV